jgi:catechol 2,3-dioxygenase-like lactoylglutathione lyase family enzyme
MHDRLRPHHSRSRIMKRLHVHVSVDNLADSIRFYSKIFAAEPTVLKDDYAKWMLDDPRVNFAISQRGADIGLNHLGIQVESGAELGAMQSRLESLQPGVEKEEDVACCYAKSDKYWLTDPSGIAWKTFPSPRQHPGLGWLGPSGAKG